MRRTWTALAMAAALGCGGSSSTGGGADAGTAGDTAAQAEDTTTEDAAAEDTAVEDTTSPTEDTAVEDAPPPAACGPLGVGACPSALTCDVQGCGAGATGKCVAKSGLCPEGPPVCGCDGETYENDCMRVLAGVAKDHDGACAATVCVSADGCATGEVCVVLGCLEGAGHCAPKPEACTGQIAPVCGCDGTTYSNDCLRLQAGASKDHDGKCEAVGPKVCGPILDGTCPEADVCDVQSCGIGATGLCVKKPGPCPDGAKYVCGCNGQTYEGDCERLAAGVAKDHDGPCVNVGKFCGGIGGMACGEGEFCSYDAGCGFDDGGGTCETKPEICPANFDPVCGCDGKTYGNACAANGAGTSVLSKGECK